jgi:hypothetical protein
MKATTNNCLTRNQINPNAQSSCSPMNFKSFCSDLFGPRIRLPCCPGAFGHANSSTISCESGGIPNSQRSLFQHGHTKFNTGPFPHLHNHSLAVPFSIRGDRGCLSAAAALHGQTGVARFYPHACACHVPTWDCRYSRRRLSCRRRDGGDWRLPGSCK